MLYNAVLSNVTNGTYHKNTFIYKMCTNPRPTTAMKLRKTIQRVGILTNMQIHHSLFFKLQIIKYVYSMHCTTSFQSNALVIHIFRTNCSYYSTRVDLCKSYRRCICMCSCISLNISRPGQNGRHSLDDIFKRIFLNENYCILISLKYVS